MPLLIPNSSSTISTSGSVPSSQGKNVWLGLQTLTASGSCTFYQTTAGCTSGSEMFSISLSPMSLQVFGPFNSPCGIYIAGIGGGCAIYMVRK